MHEESCTYSNHYGRKCEERWGINMNHQTVLVFPSGMMYERKQYPERVPGTCFYCCNETQACELADCKSRAGLVAASCLLLIQQYDRYQ